MECLLICRLYTTTADFQLISLECVELNLYECYLLSKHSVWVQTNLSVLLQYSSLLKPELNKFSVTTTTTTTTIVTITITDKIITI